MNLHRLHELIFTFLDSTQHVADQIRSDITAGLA